MNGYEYLKIVGAKRPKAEDMKFYIYVSPRDGGYAFWDDVIAAVWYNDGADGELFREGKYRYLSNLLFFPSLDKIKSFWEQMEKSDWSKNYLYYMAIYPIEHVGNPTIKCEIKLAKNGFTYWTTKKCEKRMERLNNKSYPAKED